ncbi:hypothetical protein T07_1004 [Trichinella nelsoni]|uniref:Uncharacterized protein n=1 Tax=Trichinella nelsoni TaxID=6336 RepID=A0A0V0RVN9_9BILA|nr:hypothetical protein T07_1004 [Trichinella nelsoni]
MKFCNFRENTFPPKMDFMIINRSVTSSGVQKTYPRVSRSPSSRDNLKKRWDTCRFIEISDPPTLEAHYSRTTVRFLMKRCIALPRSDEVQKSRRQSNRTFRGSVSCAWWWTAYEPNIRIHYFNNTVSPIAADTMPRAIESTLYRETLL